MSTFEAEPIIAQLRARVAWGRDQLSTDTQIYGIKLKDLYSIVCSINGVQYT